MCMARTTHERLQQLRAEKGVRQQDVADAVMTTSASVSNWETGRADPSTEALALLADYFHVSVDYLIGHSEDRRAAGPVLPTLPRNGIPEGIPVRIPILGGVRAGAAAMVYEEVEGYELMDQGLVRGGEYFFVWARGESLVGDGIADGDLVLIRRQNHCEEERICAVCIGEGEATLKRVKYVAGEQTILYSATWGPEMYPAAEVRVVGVVVKSVKYHETRVEG